MSDKSSHSDVSQDLDDFELDILERVIAGQRKTERLVGDRAFLKELVSVRERVRPQSALSEMDARVAERAAAEESQLFGNRGTASQISTQ